MFRLKDLRQEKGINQEELAKAINVKNYTIGNWERNRAEPNIEIICKLADYFEVSTDYLLGRTDDTGMIKTNANLTDDEEKVLFYYRQLNFQDKNQLLGFARRLAN